MARPVLVLCSGPSQLARAFVRAAAVEVAPDGRQPGVSGEQQREEQLPE